MVCSGNGIQLWIAIKGIIIRDDNRDDVEQKLQSFQEYIKHNFSTETVTIDKIGDLPRIIKVIGTKSIKGNTTDPLRPQRISQSISFFDRRDREDSKMTQEILSRKVSEKDIVTNYVEPDKKTVDFVNKVLNDSEKMKALFHGHWELYYPSRNEAEISLILYLIAHGVPKEQVFTLMRSCKIGKWLEQGKKYQEHQYKSATNFFQKNKTNVEQESSFKNPYLTSAYEFIKTVPLYYDDKELWWIWNHEEYCWELKDEVDLMNIVDKVMGVPNSVDSAIKNKILEALRRVGRLNKPKELSKTQIQFKNKIVDIMTEEIIESDSSYFSTNPILWEIGDGQSTPIMDDFLKAWVGNDWVLLKEILAYTLLRDYPIQRLICFNGSGANGKTTCLQLIERIVGKNNVTSTELETLVTSRFETARLYKRLVCLIGETNITAMDKTSLIKKLVGSDLISAEMKNKPPFDFHNYAKLIVATNNIPMSDDRSDGWMRRWIIIDFPQQFEEQKDVLYKIPDSEIESFIQYAVKTLRIVLERGFFTGEGNIAHKRKRFEERSDPMDSFIKEYCLIHADYEVPTGAFHSKFEMFLKKRGHRSLSPRKIAHLLSEKGFINDTKHLGVEDAYKKIRIITGLKFKETINDFDIQQ